MIQITTLERLTMSYKVLFTGFLLVIGVGLMMAGAQIMLTHGMADGKMGLSLNDIVYSYHGNRSGSKLESMLNGQMKAMAPDEVRFEIIQWARDEAPVDVELSREAWNGLRERLGLRPGSTVYLKPRRITRFDASGTSVADDPAAAI